LDDNEVVLDCCALMANSGSGSQLNRADTILFSNEFNDEFLKIVDISRKNVIVCKQFAFQIRLVFGLKRLFRQIKSYLFVIKKAIYESEPIERYLQCLIFSWVTYFVLNKGSLYCVYTFVDRL